MKTFFATCIMLLGLTATTAGAMSFTLYGDAVSNIDSYPATSVSLTSELNGLVTDLNVQIELGDADSGETFWKNINLWIEHNGVSASLMSQGGSNFFDGFFDVIFDDAAHSLISYDFTSMNAEGSFQAPDSLSIFNGLDLAGEWTLVFLDTYLPGDGTDLLSWSLTGTMAESTTQPVPEPATMILIGIGFLGLVTFKKAKNTGSC
ncbi:PEP-CTERM sorting domain-containing protein [Desulfuromonas acetoxidans]|nr:PEP-CTERM sorting domain-containing protein [Desulfuromonas acetoxidans]MBF0644490.1 PEP-CTERM sorting domain-containing protein [Desulfuromonas acetoxidans]NVD24656.1 PEP-CTERM sorting domain-containing protein [Desulfuromonas acetoxidans]NVE16701.1 PEP-CTERM sorting domain-containing protein [Desulfuromonas acetoxidans]